MKVKKSKRNMFPIGINVHNSIDNVITLYRSSNDLYDGTLDYIFFKVLNLEPEHYFNLSEMNELTDQELREYNVAFRNYEEKYEKDTNEVLAKEIKEIIDFVRKRALTSGAIEEISKGKYLETYYSFNFTFIIKCIIDYYKIKKGEVNV
ncbi:MAG: hypothetical protein ACRCX2_35180 [Paraclostridium sp.]